MFIAMNRFKVEKSSTGAFEAIWLDRDSHLKGLPGFVEFQMLRGPEREDHVLYASHTVWSSRADFEAWTKSDAFRIAHARSNTRDRRPTYIGHPEFEGFEVFQHIDAKSPAGEVTPSDFSPFARALSDREGPTSSMRDRVEP